MPGTRTLALALFALPVVACDIDDADVSTEGSMPTSAESGSGSAGSGGSSGSSGSASGPETGEGDDSGGPDTAGSGDPGGADGDFFEFTVAGAGLDRTVSRAFATDEAWGNVAWVTVDADERERLYLAFPLGDGNIALNLIASEPGTFALPQDIPVYPDILDVSFIEGGELLSFRSTNVALTLSVLESNEDPAAKTQAGLPMDGFANVEGTFSGTFEEVKANPGDRSPKLEIEASGSFRSGENF